MRWLTRSLLLSAVILIAGVLLAGCGSTGSSIKSAVASLASNATASDTSAPTPTATTPTPVATTPTAVATTPTAVATTPSAVVTTPTTAAPSPTATLSGSPAVSTGTSSNLLWLWILLGVVVLVIVIFLITRAVGHRRTAAAGWQSRVIDAYAKGSALYDAMSVAETPGALAASDAAARWYDIQRRADDLAQTLYAMREEAPDEDARTRVADTLVSLQAARSAMDAERAPGGAGPQHAEVVRSRLMSFEASLRALRGSDQQPL